METFPSPGRIAAVGAGRVGRIVAFLHGNPFNGAMFGAIAVGLGGIASRLGADPVQGGATADKIVKIATALNASLADTVDLLTAVVSAFEKNAWFLRASLEA